MFIFLELVMVETSQKKKFILKKEDGLFGLQPEEMWLYIFNKAFH